MSPELCDQKEKSSGLLNAHDFMQTAFHLNLSMTRAYLANNIAMVNFWREQSIDRKKAEQRILEGTERFLQGGYDLMALSNDFMSQKVSDLDTMNPAKLFMLSINLMTNGGCEDISKYVSGMDISREFSTDIFVLPLLNWAEFLIQNSDWKIKDYGLRMLNIAHSAIKQSEIPNVSLSRVYNLYAAYFYDKKDGKSAHKLLDSVIKMRLNPVYFLFYFQILELYFFKLSVFVVF